MAQADICHRAGELFQQTRWTSSRSNEQDSHVTEFRSLANKSSHDGYTPYYPADHPAWEFSGASSSQPAGNKNSRPQSAPGFRTTGTTLGGASSEPSLLESMSAAQAEFRVLLAQTKAALSRKTSATRLMDGRAAETLVYAACKTCGNNEVVRRASSVPRMVPKNLISADMVANEAKLRSGRAWFAGNTKTLAGAVVPGEEERREEGRG